MRGAIIIQNKAAKGEETKQKEKERFSTFELSRVMRLLALLLLMKHCRRTLAWTVKSLEDACCMQWLEKLLEE